MNIFLDVSTLQLDQAISRVGRMARFQPGPLMQIVASTVERQTMQHFEAGAGPSGAWAPTQRGGQILVDTGRLAGSIHGTAFGNIAKVGTNVFYGKFHQFGTRKMVAREFLGLTGGDRSELEEVIAEYVVGAMGI